MECPGENSIVAFAEGSLPADLRAPIEAHARTCTACGELLAVAVRTGRGQATDATAWLKEGAPGLGIPRGTTVGRYTILSLVGTGGMGEVYAAYDPELDRKVALKLLRANGARDTARGQARLLREAKALARISHRNVVAVHDAGTFEGRVFVAMEFVEGATLREWLAERPRTQGEVLTAFLEAARGLMAAHAAGLIHRDFKPSNVMVASDGSVRVADFGLARAQRSDDAGGDDDEAPPAGTSNLHATLTATGQLLGTPRYMAPEQFKAAPVDARTDQFSFCVALYEALYGEAPFGKGGLAPLSSAVRGGAVRPAPARSTVPAWLRGVLLRGLATSPEARWPSMRELIVALAGTPAKRRRRWAAVVGVALIAALGAFGLTRRSEPSGSLCHGGPARLAGIWGPVGDGGSDVRRGTVRRAFLASGAPNASEVWDRVPALLDRYAARWLAMYEDACLATHARKTQSEAALDLRMACLDDRRSALVALTDVFTTADRDVVGKAVDAVDALPDIDHCADLAMLRAPVEPPRDEATRANVAELRRRIAVVKALKDVNKAREALPLEAEIVEDARASGYRPVLAEALALSAIYTGGVEGQDVAKRLEEAIWTALSVGRNDLAALAAINRVGAVYYFAPDVREADAWLPLARTLLARAGPEQERLRAWLLNNEGLIEKRRNNMTRALALLREAGALKERILPEDHPDIAISRNALAEALHLVGKDEEALRLNDRVRATFIAAYGRASNDAAYSASNRGEYLNALGRPAEALPAFLEGLKYWEPHVGHESPNLAFPLTGMGRALVALGRAGEAVPHLERALTLRDPKQTDPVNVAETQFALGRALAASGGDARRARALAERAREAYERVKNAEETKAIDAWLATSRRSPSRPDRAPSR